MSCDDDDDDDGGMGLWYGAVASMAKCGAAASSSVYASQAKYSLCCDAPRYALRNA